MKSRSLLAGLVAIGAICFALNASAQTPQRPIPTPTTPAPHVPRNPGNLTLRLPDLTPIPSRIRTGTVSVRNGGTGNSPASVATVNCHLPNQLGGCPEIPAAALTAYTNPAYPNRVVVNIPALTPGHVHSHHLTFFDSLAFPSGSYVFDFVADAGATVAESNEANNAGSYTLIVP